VQEQIHRFILDVVAPDLEKQFCYLHKSAKYALLYAAVKLTQVLLLSALEKLRKATISFVMSVRPSVCLSVCLSARMKQFGSNRTEFNEIWYLSIFRKSVNNIQVSLKPDKNNGYFTCRPK
jgi:hypothetical protein